MSIQAMSSAEKGGLKADALRDRGRNKSDSCQDNAERQD